MQNIKGLHTCKDLCFGFAAKNLACATMKNTGSGTGWRSAQNLPQADGELIPVLFGCVFPSGEHSGASVSREQAPE